jgi:hypothetical protein
MSLSQMRRRLGWSHWLQEDGRAEIGQDRRDDGALPMIKSVLNAESEMQFLESHAAMASTPAVPLVVVVVAVAGDGEAVEEKAREGIEETMLVLYFGLKNRDQVQEGGYDCGYGCYC